MKLSFDLQEGFKNDEVTVSNKETELFSGKDISTRTQIGLAKSFEFEVPGQTANLKITVPTRRIIGEKEIDLTTSAYLAVSITADNLLEWKLSDAPFMYM